MQFYRDLPLRWVAVAIGVLIAAVWIGGLLAPEKFRRVLLKFPRSEPIGIALITLVAVWCTVIVLRAGDENLLAPKWVAYAIIWVVHVGSIVWKLEYLSVRVLAALLLLVAKVMVDAVFTVDTPTRLIIPTLAYVWIVPAIWWAMSPWKLRNAIEWMTANDVRTKAVSAVHVALAAVLVVFALLFY